MVAGPCLVLVRAWRAYLARSKTRAGPAGREIRTICLYQGFGGDAFPGPVGIPDGGGGSTLRVVPSPLGTAPGLAPVDSGVEIPAVGKPLERSMAPLEPFTF